jgi:hypothetical protein
MPVHVNGMFFDAVQLIHDGALSLEADAALCELVEAVQTARAKGSLILTLTVKPFDKTDNVTLVVDGTIKVKAPGFGRPGDVLYATPEHGLQRNDPRQPSLDGLSDELAPVPDRARGRTRPDD